MIIVTLLLHLMTKDDDDDDDDDGFFIIITTKSVPNIRKTYMVMSIYNIYSMHKHLASE